MLNSTDHEISTADKNCSQKLKIKTFLAFILSSVVFIMLINDKMSTIVDILIFLSMINLCSVKLSIKKFYNLGARTIRVKYSKIHIVLKILYDM